MLSNLVVKKKKIINAILYDTVFCDKTKKKVKNNNIYTCGPFLFCFPIK